MQIKKTFQKLTIGKTITLPIIAGVLLLSLSAFYYFRLLPYLTSAPVVQNSEPKENKSPTSTPSPTKKPLPTLKAENTPIPAKQYKFSNNEYEVSMENLSYYQISDSDLSSIGGKIRVSYDLVVKNHSVTPFVTDYQISDCIVTKNAIGTLFTANYGSNFDKGILPGEISRTKVDLGFGGKDYDSSGNPVLPSQDLKIKTCKIQFKTPGEKQGVSLHKVTETAPEEQWLVEPKTIQFSN